MRAQRVVFRRAIAGVLVALAGSVAAAPPAAAEQTCVPPEFVVGPEALSVYVCVGEPPYVADAAVHLNGDTIASVSVRFTSPDEFIVSVQAGNKEVNAYARRYTDPETGADTLEVCVTVGSLPEVCRDVALP